MMIRFRSSIQKEMTSHRHRRWNRQVYFMLIIADVAAEEKQENDDEEEEKEQSQRMSPTIIEPQAENESSRIEATPGASVPPDSIASFTYENTPEIEYPPAKRKRGRPAKPRPPMAFTEPNTPGSTADPQSLITPSGLSQMLADGDEHATVDLDQAGETKVTPSGYLGGGREYAIQTFQIIGHGEKIFMLATEVARLTGYRDSYLFFLRNRT